MKKIEYFLLFSILGLTIQEEDIKYGQCRYDETDSRKAICDAQEEGDALPKDIFLNITSLEVNRGFLSGDRPWLITEFNSFTRFSELKILLIFSNFRFSTDLTKSAENLKKQLLNIKTVLKLDIKRCLDWIRVGGKDKWVPPPNLEIVSLDNCPPELFDWRNVTSLVHVNVEYTYLATLSEFVNPSAGSLVQFHANVIQGEDKVSRIFEIYDIAFLCHLTDYSFEGKVLQSIEYYCECLRYLDWQKFLANEEKVNLTYNTNTYEELHCAVPRVGNKNCSEYTLDEAKQNRTKCLNTPATTTIPSPPSPSPPNPPKYGLCRYDKTDPSKAICDDLREGNILPNDIFLNITSLELNDSNILTDSPWLITKIDSFTRFSKLKALLISKKLEFSTNLIKAAEKLKKELFNINTLSQLTINNCSVYLNWTEVGGQDKWVPPPNLEILVLEGCSPAYFDWRNVTSLKYVKVENAHLPPLSEFVYPSAGSLVEFHTKFIQRMENASSIFKIYDIAHLCHLTYFSFDEMQLSKHYCECLRYLDWQTFLADEKKVYLAYHTKPYQEFRCTFSPKEDTPNCSEYTLDEAKQNRNMCLNSYPIITTPLPPLPPPPNYGVCSYDEIHPSEANCISSAYGAALPNNILLNITKLGLFSDDMAVHDWLLTEADSFTRFSTLNDFFIGGRIRFSTELTKGIKNLKKQLFNIKTLSLLYIKKCRDWITVEDKDKWLPPPNLEFLVLDDCSPDQFDWRDVTSLKNVKVENAPLASLSEFVNPSAGSLAEFHSNSIERKENVSSIFKIYDIAYLCHLTKFSFDGTLLQSIEHYCECLRYLDWQKFLADEKKGNLTYITNTAQKLQCAKPKVDNMTCSEYTLDEAKQNRTKCLSLYPAPTTTTTTQPPPPPEYGKCIYDEIDPDKAVCSSQAADNMLPNDIFLNITTLELFSGDDHAWLLTEVNSFTRFSTLKKLFIGGKIMFSTNLTNSMEKLKTQLFNIKPLSNLVMTHCHDWINEQGSNYKWTPPPNLENLYFRKCPPERFNWTNITSLKNVKVRETNLSSLSEFVNQSAGSLEQLHLNNIIDGTVDSRDVFKIFKIYDIAFLCHLTEYSFDGRVLQSSEHYCECLRYLDWQKFLAKNEKFTLTYNADLDGRELRCSAKKNTNCSGYTLEEAKHSRSNCLNLYPIITTTTSTTTSTTTTTTTTTLSPPPPPPPPSAQTTTTTTKPSIDDKSSLWDKLRSAWSWVKNLPIYAYFIAGILFLILAFISVKLVVKIMGSSDDDEGTDDDEY